MTPLWRLLCFLVAGVFLGLLGDFGDYGWLVVGITLGALPLKEIK